MIDLERENDLIEEMLGKFDSIMDRYLGDKMTEELVYYIQHDISSMVESHARQTRLKESPRFSVRVLMNNIHIMPLNTAAFLFISIHGRRKKS